MVDSFGVNGHVGVTSTTRGTISPTNPSGSVGGTHNISQAQLQKGTVPLDRSGSDYIRVNGPQTIQSASIFGFVTALARLVAAVAVGANMTAMFAALKWLGIEWLKPEPPTPYFEKTTLTPPPPNANVINHMVFAETTYRLGEMSRANFERYMNDHVAPRLVHPEDHLEFAAKMHENGVWSWESYNKYIKDTVPNNMRRYDFTSLNPGAQKLIDNQWTMMRASYLKPTNNQKIVHGFAFHMAPSSEKNMFATVAAEILTGVPANRVSGSDRATRDNFNFVRGTQNLLMDESIDRYKEWNIKTHPPCIKCVS